MKSILFAIVFAALAPSLLHAQNQQFSDCRTLAVAGNFVGADEVLLNGLVCKVGKPKTNSPSAATEGRAAEKSNALLGIIEPEVLRSKAGATSDGSQPAPQMAPAAAATNSTAGGAAQSPSFEPVHQKSLGEIARAYRNEAKSQATGIQEEGSSDLKKPDVERVATPSPETGTETAVSEPPPSRAPVSAAKESSVSATKQEIIADARATMSRTPLESPVAAKNQATTMGQPSSATPRTSQVTAGPVPKNAVKPEANLPPMVVTSASTDRVQSTAQTPTAEPAPVTLTKDLATISPAPSSTANGTQPQARPLLAVATSFASRPSASDLPPQPQANTIEEDGAFKEGQVAGCVKNVSLGSMDKEKLFLAIPDWALTWYEKNQKKFPGICFSDSPMSGARNYLIVFFTTPAPIAGTDSLAKISAHAEAPPVSGVGSFTTSYGFTWHYTYDRTVTTTIVSVSAEKAPHNQPSTALYATAYSDQGIPISHHAVTSIPKRNKEVSTKTRKGNDVALPEPGPIVGLLSQMLEDIAKL